MSERKGGSIFESINLSSTINDTSTAYIPPEPISETVVSISDDEDLDPAEFLSGSPELLRDPQTEKTPPKQPQNSVSVSPRMSSEFESHSVTDIDINDSILENLNVLIPEYSGNQFVPEDFNDTDSPLQYLQNEYERLRAELNRNVVLHHQALENGSDNLHKVRDAISQSFHKLSENQYSLNELYHRESTYNKQVHKRLLKWDGKRTVILDKIKLIKSDTNSYGSKLSGLLDESSGLDTEIAGLEAKLMTLKSKKRLLQNEIDVTSSVLESKTSKFVNAFKELDKNGELAIRETLRQNGLSSKKSQVLLKKIDVDVTFVKQYNKKISESILKDTSSNKVLRPEILNSNGPVSNGPERGHSVSGRGHLSPEKQGLIVPEKQGLLSSEQKPQSPSPTSGPDGMGMQAYEPDLSSFTVPEEPNDPYKKGFSRGHQQSEKFKQQLQQIYESYIRPLLEQQQQTAKKLHVDDEENTITSKIDIVPIVSFLEHKVAAYEELAKNTGEMSAIYHRYSECWRDVCRSLVHRETDLEASIMSLQAVDTSIATILRSTLDDLQSFVIMAAKITLPPPSPISPLLKLLESEVSALLKALEMVPSDKSSKTSSQYKQEFLSYGLFKDGMMPSILQTSSSSSSSRLDHTYNMSANAIEHKVMKETTPRPKVKTSSNGKSLKGE